MAAGETLTNAVIGAVVTIVTTPVLPFAPVVGGAVSGYLQEGTDVDGLKVGALAGLIAIVPLLVVLVLVGNVIVLLLALSGHASAALVGGLGIAVLAAITFAAFVYVVLLSAIGGWVGTLLQREFPREPAE